MTNRKTSCKTVPEVFHPGISVNINLTLRVSTTMEILEHPAFNRDGGNLTTAA